MPIGQQARKNNIERDFSIRRATHSDLNSIFCICHDNFPESSRWQWPKCLGLRWLKVAITSTAVEIWVGVLKKQVVGVAVIVTDEIEWAKKRRERRGHIFVWLIAFLAHPKLVLSQIISRIRTTRFTHDKTSMNLKCGERAWIEMIVVSPNVQRRGLGKRILCVCEARALELGRGGGCS